MGFSVLKTFLVVSQFYCRKIYGTSKETTKKRYFALMILSEVEEKDVFKVLKVAFRSAVVHTSYKNFLPISKKF